LGEGLTAYSGELLYVNALAVQGTNLYVGGNFDTAGGQFAHNIARWDGSAWSALAHGLNSTVNALAVSGANLFAAGWFTNAGGVAVAHIAKWEGNAWSSLGTGVDYVAYALAASGNLLYVGGRFTNAGGVLAKSLAKWDGNSWSAVAPELGGYGADGASVRALAVSGTDLYVGGGFAKAGSVAATNIAKWNGSAWSALGSGVNGTVSALAVSGTNLYAGGRFTTAGGVAANSTAKWDGRAWSALGSGIGSHDGVYALAVSGTDLYAGGPFKAAGGVPANNIAKWDGNAWSAISPGMAYILSPDVLSSPYISALAADGSNLYAGGHLSAAGSVQVSAIAKWDGSTWSALGSGLGLGNGDPPGIFALLVSGTNLYVGGLFDTAGGAPAASIAKWDGSSWSPLGTGMWGGHAIHPLVSAVSGTRLFAAGSFSTAGGVFARNIAAWDGSAWSALGQEVAGVGVTALAVIGTDLYAGGTFTWAGTVAANNIAKWNGSAWSALGPGLNGPVNALAVSGTTLYACGTFTNVIGLPYVAKWNGSTWSALGWGMGPPPDPHSVGPWPSINALAVSGTNLYAAGAFRTADGVSATNIAKWDGSVWSPLGSGVNYEVTALAADPASHLFVAGRFTTAGTNVACYIAEAYLNGLPPIPPEGAIRRIGLGLGSVTLDFLGLPGSVYELQRATDVRFTLNRTTLLTTNPPSPSGLCRYTDTSPPSAAAFYRLQRQ
jgi:Rax2 C-terminal beta propeller domain